MAMARISSKWEDGNLVFTIPTGQKIIFRDGSGSKIIDFSPTEVNCDVTFKAPTVSTEGA
jgi:hypothetical protein